MNVLQKHQTLSYKMMLLLGLMSFLWVETAQCLEEDGGFTFGEEIRHFAVGTDMVYISTEEKLYQLSHDLRMVYSLIQRGILKNKDQQGETEFYRVSDANTWNANLSINLLLPFVMNGTLVTCGEATNNCGYCEVLDLKNISNRVYSENIQVGPLKHSSTSISFLVDVKKDPSRTETYILTAIEKHEGGSKEKCSSNTETINLHSVNDAQDGGIFSLLDGSETAVMKSEGNVEFVDGFQINSTVYLLSNVRLSGQNNKVHLGWFEGKTNKATMLKSMCSAYLGVSAGGEGSRLLASSVISDGEPVLWSGVFSVDGGETNTELVVFDISPDLNPTKNKDLHFHFYNPNDQSSTRKPEAVLFKQSYMTSVLAVRQKAWMVFFIGTGDGQLIKLVVDRNFHYTCPKVLYRPIDDRRVFPKIHLDPVDHKHVYVPFRNQIKRVPVSNCSTYTTLQKCWSSQDPYCVWCASKQSCMFEDECPNSDWLSIPDESQQHIVSHKLVKGPTGQINLIIQTHVTVGTSGLSNFACHFSTTSKDPCRKSNSPPVFPQCNCFLSDDTLPADGLNFTVKMRFGTIQLKEQLNLINCSNIHGQPSSLLCHRCIKAGCGWSHNRCSWDTQGIQNDSVCQNMLSGMNFSQPEISSITPSVVSFYGRNHALLSGRDLRDVSSVRIQKDQSCAPQESPVWNNTGTSLTFHIPGTETKGVAKVCMLLPDGSCHGNANITYQSLPICNKITPNSTWISGKRKVTLTGTRLNLVDGVTHSHAPQQVVLPTNSSFQTLTYETPAAKETTSSSSVLLNVANQTLACSTTLTYHPNPQFTSFTSTRTDDNIRFIIQKKADKLEMTTADLLVWGIQDEKELACIMETKKSSFNTDTFMCEIQSTSPANIQQLKRSVINAGNMSSVVVIVYRSQTKKFTHRMNKIMEDVELNIRNEIRQGFVDLQTEKADLMENVGAIPFLDYKHFASRIFFPESETLMALCIKEIGQDVVKTQLDECSQNLSKLIQDQLFLTSMVHTLEEQKNFTIKDKCAVASLLTVALHSNLPYLTEVMEGLLGDLMQQSSNAQPKLLLRRTESIVEKLLTNWMSICLYGFLRESVGQHLFLMVSALTQQIAKGPVDCVTEKALYTLSEDWLLWQAQDFSALKLKVLFAVGSEGKVSEPLEVGALTCDTVEQLKEKILSTFKSKFGFSYNTPLRDVCIEYEKEGLFIPLREVDATSEVTGEVTKLNTLKHYKVCDGGTIKVHSAKTHPPLSPQQSLRDDENFSRKYFHLIDPDEDKDQMKNCEGKKLKLKEVHLTKLLSTKVAVHSFVENLFRSIWGLSQSRAPLAVKYFFDFLDAQADNMKITDPDVRHIWKTNSLPLRFWINILKNPQFVFDLEKTPHTDGCLSVIAQAFMDCFSLSDIQLGKHTPTNKLLYARDIPKFKQEVKTYYKQIRDLTPITDAEFRDFLQGESKKHENEFNEAAALRELYKFILRYFTEIKGKLHHNGAPAELTEQLQHVKESFDELRSCSWS
ncbi:plexin-C1 [Xenentodon cancila]